MKPKIIIASIIVGAMMAFALSGCSEQSTGHSQDASSDTSTTQSQAVQDQVEKDDESGDQGEAMPQQNGSKAAITKAQLAIGDKTYVIELANNKTAVAFAKLLPLTADMSELNGNEKYIRLDTTLPSQPTNPGTIEAGDVMLYQDNYIVVFYETHPSDYSYTRIGKIKDPAGLVETVGAGSVEMSFSAA